MEDMNKGSQQVLKKLSVGSESVTEDSKALFLKACARLIGKESLLHLGKRTLADKFTQSKDTMSSDTTRMENKKNLIILSQAQREAIRTIQSNDKLKYFCFAGGSGTGKTR